MNSDRARSANFATPQGLHSLHGQVLEEQIVILVGQFMRQLEEPNHVAC